ncbi:MAG: hypothetical protein J2P28_26545 [Actinobacteria bacterium]|nr:hypothetical protein [Actinomycetota bacterium]
MDRADGNVWGSLQHHWDSAYQFDYDSTTGTRKPFRVWRQDDATEMLGAGTPDELGHMIEEDYRRKPVAPEVVS